VINVQGEGSFFAVLLERRDPKRKNAARKKIAVLPDRFRQQARKESVSIQSGREEEKSRGKRIKRDEPSI